MTNENHPEPEFGICGTCLLVSVLVTLFKFWLQRRKFLNRRYAEDEVNAIYDDLINLAEVGDNFPHEDFMQLVSTDRRKRWRDRFRKPGDSW